MAKPKSHFTRELICLTKCLLKTNIENIENILKTFVSKIYAFIMSPLLVLTL